MSVTGPNYPIMLKTFAVAEATSFNVGILFMGIVGNTDT